MTLLKAEVNPLHRSWWSRPSRAVPAFTILLLVVGLGAFMVASKRALNRTLEQMRAEGLPMNPKELDAWYKIVPAAENAGLKFWRRTLSSWNHRKKEIRENWIGSKFRWANHWMRKQSAFSKAI
jgi:hypothetical protein